MPAGGEIERDLCGAQRSGGVVDGDENAANRHGGSWVDGAERGARQGVVAGAGEFLAFVLVETQLEVPKGGEEIGDPVVAHGPQPLLGEDAFGADAAAAWSRRRVRRRLERVPVGRAPRPRARECRGSAVGEGVAAGFAGESRPPSRSATRGARSRGLPRSRRLGGLSERRGSSLGVARSRRRVPRRSRWRRSARRAPRGGAPRGGGPVACGAGCRPPVRRPEAVHEPQPPGATRRMADPHVGGCGGLGW